MLGGMSLILLIVGKIVIELISWTSLLNIEQTIISDYSLKITVGYVFIGIVLHFFLKLIFVILRAMHKNALSSFVMLFTSILMLWYVSTASPI